MTKVLMRDIAKDKQTDSFFGKGTEKLIEEAEEKGIDVVVGEYYDKPRLDEERLQERINEL